MAGRPIDIKELRQRLGKTQAEIADPLGISMRAVQSYEQGWRTVPDHVRRMMGFLLLLDWRKKNRITNHPCWKVKGCTAENRKNCPAACAGAGTMCWMLCGTQGGPTRRQSEPLSDCACWENCPATRAWAQPKK